MTKQKAAELISIVLGPHILLPILALCVLFRTGLSSQQILLLAPILITLQVLLPIGYMYWAVKSKKAVSWDLPNMKERQPFMLMVFSAFLISFGFVYFFGNKLTFQIGIVFLISAAVMSIIGRFWKISLHSGLNTATAILVNFLFSWKFPFLYLLIPIVIWARYTQGRHDLPQLLGGAAISSIISLGSLRFFGYL